MFQTQNDIIRDYAIPERLNQRKFQTSGKEITEIKVGILQHKMNRKEGRYKTKNTRVCSTYIKIQHKIPEHVPQAEKIQHKIPECVPHTKNITQNTRAHSTRGKI